MTLRQYAATKYKHLNKNREEEEVSSYRSMKKIMRRRL
jgi:hypothetical protein